VNLQTNRVREHRIAARLTQEELARRANLPYHKVVRLDSNPTAIPRVDVAIALARALGVPNEELIQTALVAA
jgi:transcriptional regulator with XRE-family HTH domain